MQQFIVLSSGVRSSFAQPIAATISRKEAKEQRSKVFLRSRQFLVRSSWFGVRLLSPSSRQFHAKKQKGKEAKAFAQPPVFSLQFLVRSSFAQPRFHAKKQKGKEAKAFAQPPVHSSQFGVRLRSLAVFLSEIPPVSLFASLLLGFFACNLPGKRTFDECCIL